MLVLAYLTSRYWMDQIPLDPDFADMLPVIKVMNERFLSGAWKHVYDPIPEIWNGTRPIYLPAMWFPYAPAVMMKLDMRWITVTAVLLSFSIVLFNIRLRGNHYFGYGQIVIAALLFWWLFARNDVHSLISMSEEGVVIFYFVILSLAIISDNALFMGFVACCCLLSRYSMIGWLAPCLVFYGFQKDYRKLIVFSITGITCFVLFFLVPFGYKTLEQMVSLPSLYVSFAKHVGGSTPEVFWLNPGLAKFFGPHHIAILHITLPGNEFYHPALIYVCLCVPEEMELQNINLACFKLSVVIFYQLIDGALWVSFLHFIFCQFDYCQLTINSEYGRMKVWNYGSISESVTSILPFFHTFILSFLLEHFKQFIHVLPVV